MPSSAARRGAATAGGGNAAIRRGPPEPANHATGDRWDVRRSRSVRSAWGWRGFFLLSLLAAGVVIVLAGDGYGRYAIAWTVIAAGWFAVSMWLWREHARLGGGDL